MRYALPYVQPLGSDPKGFTMEVLDDLDGDEAGIKSVTFQVNGPNAYGYLNQRREVTVLGRFLLSMQQVSARHLLYPVMLCRISRRIWM